MVSVLVYRAGVVDGTIVVCLCVVAALGVALVVVPILAHRVSGEPEK